MQDTIAIFFLCSCQLLRVEEVFNLKVFTRKKLTGAVTWHFYDELNLNFTSDHVKEQTFIT